MKKQTDGERKIMEEMQEKIPNEVLLRWSHEEIGKLKTYISELEDRIAGFEDENRQLRSNEELLSTFQKNQIAKKVFEERLNKRIVDKNTRLKKDNTELQCEVNRLISELISTRKLLADLSDKK